MWNFNEIEDPEKVIIAYEPLWAISDGKNLQVVPTVEEIRAVNSGIKRVLRQIYTPEQVKKINIFVIEIICGIETTVQVLTKVISKVVQIVQLEVITSGLEKHINQIVAVGQHQQNQKYQEYHKINL